MKKILLLLFVLVSLHAKRDFVCTIDGKIMTAVMMNESVIREAHGYEYVISFNNKKDLEKVKSTIIPFLIDNRSVNCRNTQLCIKMLEDFEKEGITNLDLGPYGINYNYFKLRNKEKYFNLLESYEFACNRIMKFVEKRGYSWKSIACYHSKTELFNKSYRAKLIKNYNFLIE